MPLNPKDDQLKTGDIAPDFSLIAHDGSKVKLSGLRGTVVVLYFYPKDFTPGCTTEACDFGENHGSLEAAGAVILGISPDDEKSHNRFIDKYKLPFTLLSDPEHNVLKTYGAWGVKKRFGKESEGVIRSTFIIDRDGKLVKSWRSVKVAGHVERVLTEVEKLK